MQVILSCGGGQYGGSATLNIKIRPLVQNIQTEQDAAKYFVLILATRELVVPLASDQVGEIDTVN